MKYLLIAGFVLTTLAFASQRIVVAEEFTATWCTYCPGAARGLDEIYDRGYDSLVVIAYHSSSSDPFYTTEANSRRAYYSVSGYPTSWFDGALNEVGGLHTGTMYPFFRHHVTTRLGVSSPLEITLDCDYNEVTNTGMITATILNTSASSVSGNLHFVIVENNIPYSWQGMTELDFVMRDMLPDASGEAVSIASSDTIIRSRSFTISGAWDEHDCEIVVFVQAASRQIYQGALTDLYGGAGMEFYRIYVSEASGNGNGFIEPGETGQIMVLGKNHGYGAYSGSTSIQESDPNITITSSTPATVSIGQGDVDTVVTFLFSVTGGCPDPHEVTFTVNFNGATDDFPFIITTQPGFSDNIESGQGAWTHSGINDNWHITTHSSSSPTHSWYSGLEGSWQYSNENDASLVSPYFCVTPNVSITFHQKYSLETSWDYGYVEIDNGSDLWQTFVEVNGTQSSWLQDSYPMNQYGGETWRLRYRFVSDASVTQEGWYLDDVYIPTYIGIAENRTADLITTFSLQPNPFVGETIISLQGGSNSSAQLFVYDACGRLVRSYDNLNIGENTTVSWSGIDDQGRNVSAGIYFVHLRTSSSDIIKKAILMR